MAHRFPDKDVLFMPSDELFNNPHKGVTTFNRYNGDKLNENWSVETGWMMERIPPQEGLYEGNVKNFPDTSIAYFRIPWATLEPKEGEYNFGFVENILKTANERGQTAMLRFVAHNRRPEPDLEMPEWFCKKINFPPRELGDKRSPRHPLYYEMYGNLIREMGKCFDGDPRLDSVDLALVGAWGEGGHIEELPPEEWYPVADAYTETFKKTPMQTLFNCPEAFNYVNKSRPVGFRADCLGDMNAHMWYDYPDTLPLYGESWKKSPVQFEVCWIVKHWLDMGWDVDYIIEQALKWHLTSFNAKSCAIPEVWTDKFNNWIKKMGYRFSLRKFTYPSSASAGDTLGCYMWIENRGVAPIYHKYPFVVRLRNDKNVFDIETDADIRKWLPGDNLWENNIKLPDNIPSGNYMLEVGIKYSDERVIEVATKAKKNNGFLEVGKIEIK